MTGSATSVVAEGLASAGTALGAAPSARLQRICSRAGDVPTVAIAGRVSSGKSTLVNALIGKRVAPTDAGECTQVVTRFRFGRSEQVIVHKRDDTTVSLRLHEDGSLPAVLGCPARDVDHLEVLLPVRRLRTVELVDTPGVSSTSEAGDRTERFLALDQSSLDEVARADAVVYLLTHTGRADERRDLSEFGARAGGRADGAIGVLAKADQIAGGDATAANRLADALATALAGSVAAVLPVWTLVAETVACGRLREPDAATVAAVAELSDADRAMLFMSVEDFASRPEGPPQLARRRLQDLLAHGGVRRAVDAVRSGARGAAELTAVLDEISGRRELEDLIDQLVRRVDVLRAARMLADAWELAHEPGGDPLRDAVIDLRRRPEVHSLEETRALDALESGRVSLTERDADLARAVLNQAVPAGLDIDAAIDRWREIENLTGDLNAKHLAQVMTRSLTLHRGTR